VLTTEINCILWGICAGIDSLASNMISCKHSQHLRGIDS